MPERVLQWVSADRLLKVRAAFDHRYETARRHGNHLWIAAVSYFVNPPITDGYQLDVENMAMDPAIGCYICEEPWTAQLAGRRCKGEPTGPPGVRA